MPDEIGVAWPVYRLILQRYVTWADLKTMTIDDVERLNLAADAWQAAERRAREE